MNEITSTNAELTEKELAEHLKVSVRTLQIWRAKNTAPKHYRHGYKGVRYKLEDVLEWKSRLQCSQEQEEL